MDDQTGRLPAMVEGTEPQPPLRHVRLVLGLALLLRLPAVWTVLTTYPHGWLFQRGIEMGLLAKTLLAGKGLSSPFGEALGPTGPTAFIAPAYPFVVAAIYKLFGVESPAAAAVVMLLHIVLNLVTIWLIMLLVRRLSNQTGALVAGLFWACSPPLLWVPTIFWETSFSICGMIGLVWLILECRDHPTRIRWVVLGGLGALLVLLNSALMLPVLAMLGWLAWETRAAGWVNGAVCGLVFVVLFSPWPIRNALVFHRFIPLRTTVGFELWMGNREGATGFLEESLFPMYNMAELREYIAKGELAYSAEKSALAMGWIESHPVQFVTMSVQRFARFWMGTGAKGGSVLFALQSCLTTGLGLTGLWMLYRRRACVATLLMLPLVLFPLPYYITHAEFRYRLVIDPLLTVLAGCAVAWLGAKPAVAHE